MIIGDKKLLNKYIDSDGTLKQEYLDIISDYFDTSKSTFVSKKDGTVYKKQYKNFKISHCDYNLCILDNKIVFGFLNYAYSTVKNIYSAPTTLKIQLKKYDDIEFDANISRIYLDEKSFIYFINQSIYSNHNMIFFLNIDNNIFFANIKDTWKLNKKDFIFLNQTKDICKNNFNCDLDFLISIIFNKKFDNFSEACKSLNIQYNLSKILEFACRQLKSETSKTDKIDKNKIVVGEKSVDLYMPVFIKKEYDAEDIRFYRYEQSSDVVMAMIQNKKGNIKYFLNGLPLPKTTFKRSNFMVKAEFEDLPVEIPKNRMNNYLHFLSNIMNEPCSFIDKENAVIDLGAFMKVIESNRYENFLTVSDKINALKELDTEMISTKEFYIDKIFGLFDKNMKVSDANITINQMVPNIKSLFTLSLDALTGIRLMDINDSFVGVYRNINSFSIEQLEVIGKKYLRLSFLDAIIGQLYDYSIVRYYFNGANVKNLYEKYYFNNDKILSIMLDNQGLFSYMVNGQVKALQYMRIYNEFNKLNKELDDWINLFDYFISGYYCSLNRHYTSIKDILNMYNTLNVGMNAKELLNDVKFLQKSHHCPIIIAFQVYHNRLQAKYKVLEDSSLDKYYDTQKPFYFDNFEDSTNTFTIFKPDSLKDLIIEGRRLDHCVGSYAARVANGDTQIYFFRKKEDIMTPYFTIEVNNKRIQQIQGGLGTYRYMDEKMNEAKAVKEWAKENKIQLNGCFR